MVLLWQARHPLVELHVHGFRNSSGSLAMFAAIRRALWRIKTVASGHSRSHENGLRHFMSELNYNPMVNLENRQWALFGLTSTNLPVSERYSSGLVCGVLLF